MIIKTISFVGVLFWTVGFSFAQPNDAITIESSTRTLTVPTDIYPSQSKTAYALPKTISNTKAKISAAQEAYKEAVTAFKEGAFEKSKKYFSIFIERLSKADIDPEAFFFIFEDIDEILAKLNQLYTSNDSVLSQRNYSIPMTTSDSDDCLVRKYIELYSSGKGKERVKTAFERSGAYKDMILNTLRDFNLPTELFYLPFVESLYNPNTVSRAGAAGLWQIMPHRGRALGLQINYWIDERRDLEKSTKAACAYLKQLYLMLNDWHLVLAAYNRGEYGLIRDMKFSNASDISEMISRKVVPKETQNYVPQFIAAATIGADLENYGFTNLHYDSPQKYDIYKTDKVIDLKIVAQCAGTTVEEIKKLNPALNAWRTPHGYPGFELKIPYGSKDSFIENIAQAKDLNPSTGFIKHKVTKGEWLEKIATKYKTTPKEIYKDNTNLSRQKYLRPGQIIIIRPGRKYFV
jgi:membrane-bound lytic murein transglycosylase D